MFMKKNWNRIVILIAGIICICVILTFIIVKLVVNKRERMVSQKEAVEMIFENVYVTSLEDDKVTFLYKGSLNTFEGKVSSDCIGICDVIVKNGKIQQIYTKRESIEGNLIKYKNDTMYISVMDEIIEKRYRNDFPVYSLLDKEVKQISCDDLVLGASNLVYILFNEEIVALLQYEPCDYENIRVLMKNDNQIYYDTKVSVVQEGDYSYIVNEAGERLTRNCVGTLEVLQEEEGYVVINTLPVEEYVRYVTPSEMPYTWDMEALKAQAVCARTYAYAQMKNSRYAAFGANLDNSVDYQVYNNVGLKDSTNKAADETKYQVLSCNNELITCYFFSTSAGRTNTMEVWESDNPSFIHSVESKDTSSGLSNWKAELDYTKTDSNDMGRILEIKVLSKNKGGYITSMEIQYENGAVEYKNEYKIRKILAEHMVTMSDQTGRDISEWSLLPSASFSLDDISDETKVLVTGKGNGHGIGMSQYGAYEFAKSGVGYEEILKYYYKDVDLMDIRQIVK